MNKLSNKMDDTLYCINKLVQFQIMFLGYQVLCYDNDDGDDYAINTIIMHCVNLYIMNHLGKL